MNTRKISWEIVLAGIAFIAIGMYLFNQTSSSADQNTVAQRSSTPAPPSLPGLPSSIVIDLQNLDKLENLENLKNLKNLEELKELEIELKNIDNIIEKHVNREDIQRHLDESLKELETELQKIEKADFKVKLQDQKVYINKNYDVGEAEWSEVSPGVYIFRESFSTEGLESMDFDLGFGNVNIIGAEGSKGEITLRATGDVNDPAAFSKRMNINKQLSSSRAVFSMSSSNGTNMSSQLNLEATLTLPRSTKLNAKTSGGHINANNLNNNQQLHTSGGHITMKTIAGKTVAKTGGGHITGTQISGNAVLSTGGGHIKVQDANGSLSAKTGGGHIEVYNLSGNLVAKTSGGNISSSIQEANGPLKFYTSAGNISLQLPENLGANLDISGSVVKLADPFTFAGNKTKGSISGTINGGGVPIVISCGYGNVTIKSENNSIVDLSGLRRFREFSKPGNHYHWRRIPYLIFPSI